MMCFTMTNAAFYGYQQAVEAIAPGAFGMSMFWYKLADNILFECALALTIAYALLFRRAKADVVKWRSDVDGWFEKAGDIKRGVSGKARSKNSRADKP